MKVDFNNSPIQSTKCLILVGGSGDTSLGFKPLIRGLKKELPDYTIISFTFSSIASSGNILENQAKELDEVFQQVIKKKMINSIDIFCTSMGAFSTIRLISTGMAPNIIRRVIMFDPADYYKNTKADHTWSGRDSYSPAQELISDELRNLSANLLIDVVHLTLRNYGENGYIHEKFVDRGQDNIKGYSRLNSKMVKDIHEKIPAKDKGKYIEVSNVPHAFLRDGNIPNNIQSVAKLASSLLN